MSHSTLTWFSSQFAPKHTDELFVIATHQGTLFTNLYLYNSETDKFIQYAHNDMKLARTQVGYWAYVPTKIDFHEKLDKQSQTPTE